MNWTNSSKLHIYYSPCPVIDVAQQGTWLRIVRKEWLTLEVYLKSILLASHVRDNLYTDTWLFCFIHCFWKLNIL